MIYRGGSIKQVSTVPLLVDCNKYIFYIVLFHNIFILIHFSVNSISTLKDMTYCKDSCYLPHFIFHLISFKDYYS